MSLNLLTTLPSVVKKLNRGAHVMKWFTLEWYRYLFDFAHNGNLDLTEKTRMITCRMGGHKAGPIWHSSGWEPDMTCRNCGDEI